MSIAPDFIKSLSAVSKISPRHGEIINRKNFGLHIRVTGTIRYNFSDKSIVVTAGEMIFIPKGISYTYCVESHEDSVSVLLNMDADFKENISPKVYPLKDVYGSEYIINQFVDSWNFGTMADRYKCIAHLYDLLSYISNYNNLEYMEKKKFKLIDPALNYLKSHIYDSTLKADDLAAICGISNTYFREIFALRFGSSPKNYITEKRMSRAKAIIDNGEFDTVKNLAISVGYDDPLYFGKVFKKHFGMPPATINK